MRALSSSAVLGAAVMLACPPALAQTTESDRLPGFQLERLDTNMGRGTILVGNGELMVPGGLSVSLLSHYERQPLRLDYGGLSPLQVVKDRATAMLSASYGLLPWLEVGAQLPFVLWQQGDNPTDAGLSRLAAQGLGTPVLQARLGLLSRQQQQPVDLSADLGVGLPVGSGTALAGDDGPRFHVRMVVGTVVGWLQPSLEAGVLFRPAILLNTPGAAATPGAASEVRLGAALATTGRGMRGELGLRATLNPKVAEASLDLLGGARLPLLVGLDAFVMGGPGIGSAPGTPSFRMLAGVAFRQEPPPRFAYLNEEADRALRIALATAQQPPVDDSVRPVPTWVFNSLAPGEQHSERAGPAQPSRPYQTDPKGKVVVSSSIAFKRGSAELPSVVPFLDQAAVRLLEQSPSAIILIEGYADDEGSETETIMSMRRAQAIRRYLVDQVGVSPAQVKSRYFGSSWPVSSRPATEQERQLNRRAEVRVLTPTSEAPAVTTQAPAP